MVLRIIRAQELECSPERADSAHSRGSSPYAAVIIRVAAVRLRHQAPCAARMAPEALLSSRACLHAAVWGWALLGAELQP